MIPEGSVSELNNFLSERQRRDTINVKIFYSFHWNLAGQHSQSRLSRWINNKNKNKVEICEYKKLASSHTATTTIEVKKKIFFSAKETLQESLKQVPILFFFNSETKLDYFCIWLCKKKSLMFILLTLAYFSSYYILHVLIAFSCALALWWRHYNSLLNSFRTTCLCRICRGLQLG